MAIARPILSLISILLLAGGIVMTFLIVLSGAHIGNPVNKVYFLQAATNGITGGNSQVHNPARWTYLAVCGVANGLNYECGASHPAQAFAPVRNFGTSQGVPAAFIGTTKFYYLSRFAWAFYIIALFFAVLAFFLSLLALCTRLGAYLSGLNAAIALFFQTLAAALMTYVLSACTQCHYYRYTNEHCSAWTVIARNDFRKNGQTARLGEYAYAFTWATMFAYLLATIFLCVGGSVGKNKDSSYQKKSYFGRKRSTRSRGSFIDNESQRRVKDEYD